MMQPAMDPLSQLAMCCGLNRKRGYRQPALAPRSFYYSPSHTHFDTSGGLGTWPMTQPNQFNLGLGLGGQMQQPYLLVTQPVILTTNNPLTNQTSTTMATLVPQAQTAPGSGTYQTISIMPAESTVAPQQHQQQIVHQQQPQSTQQLIQQQTPRLLQSSQYAIYQSPMHQHVNPGSIVTQDEIYGDPRATMLSRIDHLSSQQQQQQLQAQFQPQSMVMASSITNQAFPFLPNQMQAQGRRKNLSSEIFRQIDMIEKQVDLSRDMEFVERNQVVITRAIVPSSLMPHLSEATLMRYNNQFLISDDYVIRFIEVIKRPGQTLGIYIRTVQFEGTRGVREGVIITKIDSESPVYNSQVLHVGDEIISINLVDIQGMGLDDVVIIMSIPKRLVLALRIPKERDQLLKLNMAQQQQLQMQIHQQIPRFPMENRAATSPMPYNPIGPGASIDRANMRDDLALRSRSLQQQQQVLSNQNLMAPPQNQRTGGNQRILSHLSPLDEFTIDEMRREMSRNSAINDDNTANNTDEIYHARPVRVSSAILMRDVANQDILIDHQNSTRFTGSLRAGPRYSADNSNVSPNLLENKMSNFNDDPIRSIFSGGHDQARQFSNEFNGRKQTQRPITISKSKDDMAIGLGDNRRSLEQREYQPTTNSDLESDFSIGRLDQLREFTGGMSSASYRNGNTNIDQNLFANDGDSKVQMSTTNNSSTTTTSTGTTIVTPVRRSLPQPPPPLDSMISDDSNSSSAKQQNIISNIRLGNTPEQSSYFSSSIDAINRELKELRRQRMALSSNEQSIESNRPDYRGSPPVL